MPPASLRYPRNVSLTFMTPWYSEAPSMSANMLRTVEAEWKTRYVVRRRAMPEVVILAAVEVLYKKINGIHATNE